MREFIRCVLSSDEKQIEKHLERNLNILEENLNEFKDLFNTPSQIKFLNILFKFFRTKNKDMLNIFLSQIMTLSGIKLNEESQEALIDCKNYSGLKFSAKDVKQYWKPLLKKEATVAIKNKKKEQIKNNSQKYFSVLASVSIFLRAVFIKGKSRSLKVQSSHQIISKQSVQELKAGKELPVEAYFDRVLSFEYLFLCFKKNAECLNKYGIHDLEKSPEYLLTHIEDSYYSPVHVLFSNNKLYLKSTQRNHYFKIIIPKKIFGLRLLEPTKAFGVYIEYDQGLRMLIKTKKTSPATKLFGCFSKLVNEAKKIRLIPEGQALLDVKPENTSKEKRSFFLEKLYLLTKYEFKYPAIRQRLISEFNKIKDGPKWTDFKEIKKFGDFFGFSKAPFRKPIGEEIDAEQDESQEMKWDYTFPENFKYYGFTDPQGKDYHKIQAQAKEFKRKKSLTKIFFDKIIKENQDTEIVDPKPEVKDVSQSDYTQNELEDESVSVLESDIKENKPASTTNRLKFKESEDFDQSENYSSYSKSVDQSDSHSQDFVHNDSLAQNNKKNAYYNSESEEDWSEDEDESSHNNPFNRNSAKQRKPFSK
jgi:hypothetical protein